MILMLYLMQRDGYQGEKDRTIGARGRIKREILVSNACLDGSGPTSKLFDTRIVFLKEFFGKIILKKVSRQQKSM